MSAGILLEWAWSLVRGRKADQGAWLMAPAAFVGPLAMVLFFWRRFGRPFAQFEAQRYGGRKPPSPGNLLLGIREEVRWILALKPLLILTLGLILWAGVTC